MTLSRIGKAPIEVPEKVKIDLNGDVVRVQGPNGTLERTIQSADVKVEGAQVLVSASGDPRTSKARHGLARALIQNMVTGVSTGFQRKLEINGVGYRAELKGKTLELSLGYSHPVKYVLPEGIKASVEKMTSITVESADKELLGRVAAKIRGFRPPDPYKAKGVTYAGERVRRKVGKAGVK